MVNHEAMMASEKALTKVFMTNTGYQSQGFFPAPPHGWPAGSYPMMTQDGVTQSVDYKGKGGKEQTGKKGKGKNKSGGGKGQQWRNDG